MTQAMTAQQQAMAAQQMNYNNRQNLLQSGISMIKRLQPMTGKPGDSIQIPLLRMGIMTGVMLHFSVAVGAGGTLASPSPCAPFNIAQSVKYTDFAGVDRTKTNGFQLWAAQSMKQGDLVSGTPFVGNAVANAAAAAFGYHNSNILSELDRASEYAANASVNFSIYVPMAYDPASDLTGAVLTQTNVGEHYITVQLPNSLVGADPWAFPFQAGAAANAVITVQAFQYYIQPQNMSAQMLPLLDLSTVYGFEGNYQATANIAAGQATYVNFPNNRSILSALIAFENNAQFTPNETDVSLMTLVANSNTNFKEMSPRLIRETMRHIAGADLPSSQYYLGFRRQPIMTQLYANVQAKFDVASVAGAGLTQFIAQYEVQYPSGSALPGITA